MSRLSRQSLPELDYVTFGSLLSQSVVCRLTHRSPFLRPTQGEGLKLLAIFLRHLVP